MAFDSSSNTITIGPDSDFMVDSGVFFITALQKMSQEKNPPPSLLKDWEIIENWLGCSGRRISKIDEDKIAKAWKAYLAIGLAPSFKLQGAFDLYCEKYKEENYSFKEDKPPTEIMDVFDRQLATDEEITQKRKHDLDVEKKKFEQVFKKYEKKQTLKQRITPKTKTSKSLLIFTIAWLLWVIFRTADDFELLGIYFDSWDEDMFFVNLLLPILSVWFGLKIYKWVANTK